MKNLIISLIQKIVALGNGYLTPMTDHNKDKPSL